MIEETIRALIVASYENVFIGEAPIDKDNCQWIKASAGSSTVHFDKETYDYPHYTIYVRGANNQETKNRVNKIYRILNNFVGNEFVILTRQLPRFAGKDQKHRSIYSFGIEYQLGGY